MSRAAEWHRFQGSCGPVRRKVGPESTAPLVIKNRPGRRRRIHFFRRTLTKARMDLLPNKAYMSLHICRSASMVSGFALSAIPGGRIVGGGHEVQGAG